MAVKKDKFPNKLVEKKISCIRYTRVHLIKKNTIQFYTGFLWDEDLSDLLGFLNLYIQRREIKL